MKLQLKKKNLTKLSKTLSKQQTHNIAGGTGTAPPDITGDPQTCPDNYTQVCTFIC